MADQNRQPATQLHAAPRQAQPEHDPFLLQKRKQQGFAAVQTVLAATQAILLQRLTDLEDRSQTRILNSHCSPGDALYPILVQGRVPMGFPATPKALANLSSPALTTLLQECQQTVPVSVTAQRVSIGKLPRPSVAVEPRCC